MANRPWELLKSCLQNLSQRPGEPHCITLTTIAARRPPAGNWKLGKDDRDRHSHDELSKLISFNERNVALVRREGAKAASTEGKFDFPQ